MSGAEILAFCRARLDDEERLALAAEEADPSPWGLAMTTGTDNVTIVGCNPTLPNGYEANLGEIWDDEGAPHRHGMRKATADFVARRDPKRALAAVEADRAILDFLAEAQRDNVDNFVLGIIEQTVRLLASRWSWHEDYRAEWAA